MAEQATEEKKEEKKEESSGKMKASKELFDKRKDLMDLESKADFKEGDKFGYLCDDGVLIECEVIRPHSKGGKVFVSLGEHHGHLTENHSCWIDLPNTRICSLEKMSEVQIQFKRIKSTESAVEAEIQNLVESGTGGDKASEILNNLTKQPSVLKNIADSAPADIVAAEQKKDEPKDEPKKEEPPKQEPPKEEPPKDDQKKEEEPPKEQPKEEQPKEEVKADEEPPKEEPPKEEPPKEEPPKEEAKADEEPPKEEAAAEEAPKEEEQKKDDQKKEAAASIPVITTKDYVFKSMDKDNKKMVCLDADFNDVSFDLPSDNKELMDKIDKVVQDGKDTKKDVTITISKSKVDDKVTVAVQDAKIAEK